MPSTKAAPRPVITDEAQRRNLEYLVVVTRSQLAAARAALSGEDSGLLLAAVQRDAYIDNLKNRVRNHSYRGLAAANDVGDQDIDAAMAVNTIARNLEKIGDYALAVIKHAERVERERVLPKVRWRRYFNAITQGLELTVACMEDADVDAILSLCQIEDEVDAWHRDDLAVYLDRITGDGPTPGDDITALLVLRELEKMGDALLNMGEALLSFAVGSKLKLNQFHDLVATLKTDSDLDLTTLGEDAKSGCKIELVSQELDDGIQQTVYKVGPQHKIEPEFRGIQAWHAAVPGVAPAISGYREQDDRAAMMIEFLPGSTFQEILIGGSDSDVDQALTGIWRTLTSAWDTTRTDTPVACRFMDQLRARWDAIAAANPALFQPATAIGDAELPPFQALVKRLRKRERDLDAPFEVLLHGDCNLDNVVYDPVADTGRLLDLHRAKRGDYVQDVSVFLISGVRLPIHSKRMRKRIARVVRLTHDALAGFATKRGDKTYQARLAFGLVRSLTTSTRFEMDPGFAENLQKRAQFLAEKLADYDGKWSKFDVPIEALDL